jgi:hypothetical protein
MAMQSLLPVSEMRAIIHEGGFVIRQPNGLEPTVLPWKIDVIT